MTTGSKPRRPAVLGIAAWSGSGKTTLLRRLLPLLRDQGLRVALIKHAHHDFDIDKPGKDSYELRKAGAEKVLLASARRAALVVERPQEREPALEELLRMLGTDGLDLVLVEGFKRANIPKIEVHRSDLRKPPLFPHDANIVAVAANGILPGNAPSARQPPLLNLDDPPQVAAFIMEWMKRRA